MKARMIAEPVVEVAAVSLSAGQHEVERPQAQQGERVGGEDQEGSSVTPYTAGTESTANTMSVANTATTDQRERGERPPAALATINWEPR